MEAEIWPHQHFSATQRHQDAQSSELQGLLRSMSSSVETCHFHVLAVHVMQCQS